MFKVQNRDKTQEKVIGVNFVSIFKNCLHQPLEGLALMSEMDKLISFRPLDIILTFFVFTDSFFG